MKKYLVFSAITLFTFISTPVVFSQTNTPPNALVTGESANDHTVTVNATYSSDADGDPLTYTWDYGDGSAAGSGETTTHTYQPQTIDHVLLLHGDASPLSDAMGSHTVSAFGNAGVDTSTSQFGSSSISFDGSGDYLSVPDSADWDMFASNQDDRTLDFWVKRDDTTGTQYLFAQGTGSERWYFYIKSDGMAFINVATTPGVFVLELTIPTGITDTNWHHIAFCKVGDEYAVYVDGAQKSYVQETDTANFAAALNIGRRTDGTSYFDGNLDEIRFSDANSFNATPNATNTDTITVPQSPYSTQSSFTITLTANDGTDTGTDTFQFTPGQPLPNNPPIPAIGVDSTNEFTVNMNASSSVDPEGSTLTYAWDFGDGNTATSETVVHTYADPNGEDSNLLIHFDNNITDDAFGNHTATVGGGASLDTTNKQFGAGSVNLDGSGDYLEIPDSDDFYFADENFTIDFWINFNSIPSSTQYIFHQTAGSSNRWNIRYDPNNDEFRVTFITGGVNRGNYHYKPVGATVGTWMHIALVRNGTDLSMYKDGTALPRTEHVAIGANSIGNIAAPLNIGRNAVAAGYEVYGKIDELRIVKAQAKWTSNFTPFTIPYTDGSSSNYMVSLTVTDTAGLQDTTTEIVTVPPPNQIPTAVITLTDVVNDYTVHLNGSGSSDPEGSTLTYSWDFGDGNTATGNTVVHTYTSSVADDSNLLFHFDDDLATDTMGNHTPTEEGNVNRSTTTTKFGNGSASFDGAGDHLLFPDSDDFYFAAGDFTIDFWVNFNTIPSHAQYMFHQRSDNSNRWNIRYDPNNDEFRVTFITGGVNRANYHYKPVGAVAGNWKHIALIRNGNALDLYVDGTALPVTEIVAIGSNSIGNIAAPLHIGINALNDGSDFDGYIDELRIVKGQAKWTANFTPPSIPYSEQGEPNYTITLTVNDGEDDGVDTLQFSPGVMYPLQLLSLTTTASLQGEGKRFYEDSLIDFTIGADGFGTLQYQYELGSRVVQSYSVDESVAFVPQAGEIGRLALTCKVLDVLDQEEVDVSDIYIYRRPIEA